MKNFKEKEIPYDELEMIGIKKEMFLDLPKEAINRIMIGRLSPMLTLDQGVQAKIALQKGEDNKLHVFVYPRRNEIQNTMNLSPDELEKLKKKEVITATIEKDGKNEKVYVQMDEDTKTLITVRKDDVKLPNAIGDIVLGNTDKDSLREGKPIELEKEDTKITVGVDLNSRGGFRILDGDLDEWREKKLIEWDKMTPGVKGYWKTTENVLTYEEYHKEKKGMNVEEEEKEEQTQRTGFRMKR